MSALDLYLARKRALLLWPDCKYIAELIDTAKWQRVSHVIKDEQGQLVYVSNEMLTIEIIGTASQSQKEQAR